MRVDGDKVKGDEHCQGRPKESVIVVEGDEGPVGEHGPATAAMIASGGAQPACRIPVLAA